MLLYFAREENEWVWTHTARLSTLKWDIEYTVLGLSLKTCIPNDQIQTFTMNPRYHWKKSKTEIELADQLTRIQDGKWTNKIINWRPREIRDRLLPYKWLEPKDKYQESRFKDSRDTKWL